MCANLEYMQDNNNQSSNQVPPPLEGGVVPQEPMPQEIGQPEIGAPPPPPPPPPDAGESTVVAAGNGGPSKKIIIAVVAVTLLIAVGIAAYFLFFSGGQASSAGASPAPTARSLATPPGLSTPPSPTAASAPPSSVVSTDTTLWETHEDSSFSFKYPSELVLTKNLDGAVEVGTASETFLVRAKVGSLKAGQTVSSVAESKSKDLTTLGIRTLSSPLSTYTSAGGETGMSFEVRNQTGQLTRFIYLPTGTASYLEVVENAGEAETKGLSSVSGLIVESLAILE